MLSAVIDGGAKVVGLDIVFRVSIEQSQMPFGDSTLGAHVPGFDRDWLRALLAAAKQGKVVLGQVQFRDQPIQPPPGQRIAVGQQKNIRPLNTHMNSDDVARRLPFSFEIGGQRVNGMAVELAARALGRQPEPPAAFRAGHDHSEFRRRRRRYADLCAGRSTRLSGQGHTDYFRRPFAGKVVIIGTLLDAEDRRVSFKSFATGREATRALRRALPVAAAMASVRDTGAGVYLHATAVNNLMRGDTVRDLDPPAIAAITLGFAAGAVGLAFMVGPLAAAALWLGVALV